MAGPALNLLRSTRFPLRSSPLPELVFPFSFLPQMRASIRPTSDLGKGPRRLEKSAARSWGAGWGWGGVVVVVMWGTVHSLGSAMARLPGFAHELVCMDGDGPTLQSLTLGGRKGKGGAGDSGPVC